MSDRGTRIPLDWHEYECAHEHRWWSAPTSTRCPVCGTSTYKPLRFEHGTLAAITFVPDDVVDVDFTGKDQFDV